LSDTDKPNVDEAGRPMSVPAYPSSEEHDAAAADHGKGHDRSSDPKRKRIPADEVIDDLASLIESPFLDQSGTAYCRVPSDKGGHGVVFPLRDRKVRSNLAYRYRQSRGHHAGPKHVNAAIDYVEGQLIQAWRPNPDLAASLTWRCFAGFLVDEPSGTKSANDILVKLREVARANCLLTGFEHLPDNATAMGKWLARHQIALRAQGIELSRPTRHSTTRLWAWQTVEPDDAGDTSIPHESWPATVAAAPKNTERVEPDDTMSDAQLRKCLGGSLDDSGN